ncbi:MAG: peroxidase family protein, partial [Hyphomicrobiaceae bacterium]
MVTMIRSDLDFILAQIKIAEADARGEELLGTYIPNPELPWGLRRVDGSNNNLLPGQSEYGAAGNPFPRATDPVFINEADDAMSFGPGGTLTNNDYGIHTPNNPALPPRAIQPGDVVDADPRIISNLIVDQSLNNPAAIMAALKFAGSADLATDTADIIAKRDALAAARAAAQDVATLEEIEALLQQKATADAAAFNASVIQTTAQIAKDDAQSLFDTANADEALAETASNNANTALLEALTTYGADPSAENELALNAALVDAMDKASAEQAAEQELSFAAADLATANQELTDANESASIANAEAAAADAAYQAALTSGESDPAVIAARDALSAELALKGLAMDGEDTLVIPNVAPDEGLSAPFNGWMTLFGQFFDHGLDLVAKGGYGTVYIPLQEDDPLYVAGSPTNFMALTRSTLGPDGEPVNLVTPFVDQNQTYTSNASHQVFLREYEMRIDPAHPEWGPVPFATGRLLNGSAESGGGLATWANVKAQALDMLGIALDDHDIHSVPELMVDAYGNFIRGANGFPQVVTDIAPNGQVTAIAADPNNPVAASLAVKTGVAFLDDIAHNANPGAGETADSDIDVSTVPGAQPVGTYDDELLDAHYITGDGRGNENIGLTTVHHVFHSEHNRQIGLIKDTLLADAQSQLDGGATEAEAVTFLNEWLAVDVTSVPASIAGLTWDGERLFQAAKLPTEMQYQHLVFEEFARKVQPFVNVFNDYDGQLNAAIVGEFAHTVYRFGHSMLTETVDRFDAEFNPMGSGGVTGADQQQIGLIEAFLNPLEFAASGIDADAAAGAVVRGMTRQRGNEIDEFVTEALRNNLVGLPLDLAALNIARARETGVPSLNEARAQFYEGSTDSQVKPYVSWYDFALNLKNPASVINFIAAYGTHASVTTAGSLAEKRDAATALVLGTGDNVPTDRIDFLNATGDYAGGSLGGLNAVDFWIGGLAEKKMVFGGMLGSTFNFVFETQLEALQNGDRFYYLSRLANLNLTAQLENNKFSEMIHRNTDATHLPGDAFARPDYFLEVDQTKQFNADLGGADPTGGDPILEAIQPTVSRADLDGDGDGDLQFRGVEHVVLGGTSDNDVMIGDKGDDTLWGDAGDDRLEGGEGNDFFFGGEGADIITDVFGDDEVRSGGGDDVVNGGQGLNLIITDTGRDFVWGGVDDEEFLLGQGDDFADGGAGSDFIIAGEGNDWVESGTENGLLLGDNGDLVQGLPIKRSVDSRVVGHDVLVSTGGNADFDAETGDDIMVGGLGTDRFFGQFGFDWATYKNDPYGIEADMNLRLFAPPTLPASPGAILDRYAQTEALSGSAHTDFLRGDDVVDLAGGAAAPLDGLDHALYDTNVSLIAGLEQFLGGVNEVGDVRFSGGNILLGGSGSDIIEGRGGNDVIDGDRWLDVQIRVTADPSRGQTFDPFLIDGLAEIQSRMFTGEIRVGQLEIQRSLKDTSADADVDVAEFSGLLADYAIEGYNAQSGVATDTDGDGFISVTHLTRDAAGVVVDGVLGIDGVDRLNNVERVLFADGTLKIGLHENRIAEGRASVSGLALDGIAVTGQVLTASLAGVVDTDGIAGPVEYIWQVELVPGTGLYTTLTTIVGDELAPVKGETFTVTAAEAGLAIRVLARFKDADGAVETVYSNVEAGGNPNEPPIGLPVISDTTPTEGQALVANTDAIQDIDGLGAFSFQWQQSADGGTTWNNIAGATNASFTPAQAQVSGLLRVNVSFTDGGGTPETVSSAATAVVGDLINDGVGVIPLNGTAGSDNISGNGGADTINGLAGDDILDGGIANDLITGGAGDDAINGGASTGLGDIAAFAGSASVFDITISGASLIVTDQTGVEGTDTLTNVERLRFGVQTLTPVFGTDAAATHAGDGNPNLILGFGGADVMNGLGGADALLGGAGNDTITGGVGNDAVSGGAGDDTIIWGVTSPAGIIPAINDGRDVVHGGTGGTDTFVINGNSQDEVYRVYARADWLAVPNVLPTQIAANTEIIVTRSGTGNLSVIAELDEIEEIVINTGAGNDTVLTIGDFNPTNLSFNTITINDGGGSDTVDVRQMSSAHHIAFHTSGNDDTFIGARAQDEVFGAVAGGTASGLELTASDLASLKLIVTGGAPADDGFEGVLGVRTLSGDGNNQSNTGFGAADTPFIRITEAHYGSFDPATGNRSVNPMFDGLDARTISNILGTQEIDLPKNANDGNIFLMAFGQYFDHGL